MYQPGDRVIVVTHKGKITSVQLKDITSDLGEVEVLYLGTGRFSVDGYVIEHPEGWSIDDQYNCKTMKFVPAQEHLGKGIKGFCIPKENVIRSVSIAPQKVIRAIDGENCINCSGFFMMAENNMRAEIASTKLEHFICYSCISTLGWKWGHLMGLPEPIKEVKGNINAEWFI